MPVSHLQHRVSIGLFQGRVVSCKYCVDFVFLDVFLHWILLGIIGGIIRVGMYNLSGYFVFGEIRYYKAEFDGIYSFPVILDIFSCALCICYYLGSVKTFVLHVMPSMQIIRLITSYLEIINFLLYFILGLLLLLAGDIHENPGPETAKTKFISTCHVNIRSLTRSKLLAIQSSFSNNYDIITLSETYLHTGVSDDVFRIQGFHDIIRKDRDGHGGGVAVYIRDNIAYKRLYEFDSPSLEALWLSINTIEGKVLFCCCYRPPDRNDFWMDFDNTLENIKQSNNYKYMFILGDLNADFNSSNGRKLLQLCNDNNLHYLVNEPTRITANSQTVLDQILSNAPNFISNVTVSPPLSTNDHCTVSATINFKIQKKESFYRHVWLFKDANFDQFRQDLMDTNFDSIFVTDNVDDVCRAWSDKFLTVAKKAIPNRTILVRPNDSPWYTSKLRLMKRKMLRLFRKFKNSRSDNNWEGYKRSRNEYQHALDVAEEDYKNTLTSSLASGKNTKLWWRTVKNLLGKGSFRSLPPLEYNNTFLTDDKDKATAFNNFFLSHSNINTNTAHLPPTNNVDEKLISVSVTEQEVYDLINSLDTSKATGPDGIGPKLLREAGYTIVPSLTKLFNLCLDCAQFPSMWKLANVLPLYKKGDASDVGNYRPVSLLSCTSKLLERVVFKNLFNYIRDNNILTPHQSGFQSGDSTTHQLSYLYHVFCKALDSKKDVRIVFCDISKAFDRVWHDGLLYKLSKIGVGGKLLQFLKHYLSERQQCVVVQGQTSEPGNVKAGVPQGSVLGPLLFLVYINDLTNDIVSNIKLFADDTSLYIEVDDPKQSADILNQDLRTLKNWADQWLVTFSAPKTKLLTCSFKNVKHPNIVFDNLVLSESSSHKHLGLTITTNLSWSSHIHSIVKSVSPIVDVLKKLKYRLDRETLEKIYFSFIRSKLEYGCYIWDNCTKSDAKLLEDLQLNIARIVSGARKGTSHELIYNELHWPSLADRRKGFKLKNFVKIISNEAPGYLQSTIPPTFSVIRPESRIPSNFYPIHARTETFKNSFIPSSISYWNSLAISDRSLSFIKSIMHHVKTPLFYYGNREINVKHAQLRMKCSKLNYHLYSLHVIDSPVCPCGYKCEDSNHFLLHCPLFHEDRLRMFIRIGLLGNFEITCSTLLYGSDDLDLVANKKLFDCVHVFIDSSGRL